MTAAELTSADWELVHRFRNTRALVRRLDEPHKSRFQERLVKYAEQARARGIPWELMKQWRAYPTRMADGSLQFGWRIDARAETVEAIEPPKRTRKPRPRPAPSSDGGELLAQLEASVEQAKRKRA